MGINRTDVLKQYKMPEVKGHFYTEARLWMALAVDGYKLEGSHLCARRAR